MDVSVRRCGLTPGNPCEKLVESLAKLHMAPLRRVDLESSNKWAWEEAYMLMIPGGRRSFLVSEKIRTSQRRRTMRVITKQVRPICREIALLK